MGKYTYSLVCKICGKEWTILQICDFLLLLQYIFVDEGLCVKDVKDLCT